ncbi:hypothetical protein [Klenkia terrae]|uniref:Uncharacterized protein n=1 Tax=Klenkia terrae TaxID=1052259 RepID=A0ABU8ECU5_9ACTN|nr:hypothetical protein [Klenkia terrae]SSC24165.1 Hypothetical protein KLENKIAIHU_2772 [Klenkia terrae]
MRRAALVCLPTALLVAACSTTVAGSASPAPTTAASPSSTSSSAPAGPSGTDDPSDDDLNRARNLVDELYAGLSSSTEGGLAAYADFLATHNHPEFSFGGPECLTFLQGLGLTDTYRALYTPDLVELDVDPGWQVPDGRYAGLAPDGDVYSVPITVDEADTATGSTGSYSATVHAAVLDDEAFFFQPCEP